MGSYDNGTWKWVNGNQYYVVANEGVLFQSVRVRDGKWSTLDNTLSLTVTLSFRGMGLEEQIAKTLSKQVEKDEKSERKEERINDAIDTASEKVDEIYSDDW